jgi:soluble lytic murein transglycosylase-like protein
MKLGKKAPRPRADALHFADYLRAPAKTLLPATPPSVDWETKVGALQVWANESDNKAGAHNPHGDASGIFQLMPSTAKDLGYPISADPHLSAYRLLGWGTMPIGALVDGSVPVCVNVSVDVR